MRVVQALSWLKDTLDSDRSAILSKLAKVLADRQHGKAIRQDLLDGFKLLPTWMQNLVQELPDCDPKSVLTLQQQSPSTDEGQSVPVN